MSLQARVTNYLTVPNPINMCQPHLGRLERIHTKLHLQTDAMHVVKCLLGTGIRLTNWVILAHLMLKVRILFDRVYWVDQLFMLSLCLSLVDNVESISHICTYIHVFR